MKFVKTHNHEIYIEVKKDLKNIQASSVFDFLATIITIHLRVIKFSVLEWNTKN